jgi:hypothetical protein
MGATTTYVLLSVALIICLTAMGNGAAQSSASYELTRSVMSGGGTTSTSASYELTGTFGQPSPVEVSESPSSSVGSGFWGRRFACSRSPSRAFPTASLKE